jgi:hypothetical protein
MAGGNLWEPEDIQTAITLKARGATYAELAAKFNRTPHAVRDAISRNTSTNWLAKLAQENRRSYLGCYDGPPIENTKADTDYIIDAQIGSEKLLRRLFEVFAPERIAA